MKNNDVIIACDFPTGRELMEFLELFGEKRPYVKIGMELFYAEGPEIIKKVKNRGHQIFLDVKVHDIPATVRKTMEVLSHLDIDMVNLHAGGGREMMREGLEGLRQGKGKRPLLIAVTQLTSTDQKMLKEELLIDRDLDQVVISYAKMAQDEGLDGVVCSALEAEMVHRLFGNHFLTVTPGIRFNQETAGDQKRILSPRQARLKGSDYIVVGRPITQAEDPLKEYLRCVHDFIGEDHEPTGF